MTATTDAPAPEKKRLIGELLIEEGLITRGQLEEALKLHREKGGKTVENLIALQYLDTRTFLHFLSKQPGVASIDLLNYTIPREIIELIPAEFAKQHEILPLDRMGRDLTVGMACPLDSKTIGHLESITKLRVRPLLVSLNDIAVALERYYGKPKGPATFSLDASGAPVASNAPAPETQTVAQAPVEPTPAPVPQAPAEPTPAPVVQAPAEPTPAPVVQAPVEPTPAPVAQAPAEPTPAPVVQAPVEPTPAPVPQAPVEPTPAPVAQAPVEPTPAPEVVASTESAPPEEEKEAFLSQVESALKFESVLHLVREISSLPALPETVQRVRETMDLPDCSTKEVAHIIAKDPLLSAKIISLANSAAYGLPQKVDNIDLATSLLGLREVYSVVLSAAVIDYFDESRDFNYKEFWRRSMLCATAAKTIAANTGEKNSSGLFSAGMLHDIGRAVFAEIAPERYGALDQSLPDEQLIAEEEKVFGVSHPEVGYILATTWQLPEDICESIRFHHQIEQAQSAPRLVAIISLASLMTDAYGKISKENVMAFANECRGAMKVLEIDDRLFIKILGQTAQAIKKEVNGADL